jgi:sugar phosphate isomerase/epimerase
VRAKETTMKLAFMSSVCPKMTLAELLAVGARFKYDGIEFRPEWSQAHGIELTATAAQRKEAAERLAGSPLEACCLSPGVRFCSETPAERDAQQDLLARYVDLAAEVGIRRIRVFGDPIPNGGSGRRAANYRAQAECLARGAEVAEAGGVRLVLETHGNFRAFDAGEVMFQAGYPAALLVNWHLGHCLRHGEDVDEAYRQVKGRVGHCHFALGEEKTDPAHLHRQASLLADERFDGFFSVEVINPDNGEQALDQHAKFWKEVQSALGA